MSIERTHSCKLLKIPKIQIKVERFAEVISVCDAEKFSEGEPSKASSFIPIKSIN